jgi:threonine/homoserine/homoserine lactone efflux protein
MIVNLFSGIVIGFIVSIPPMGPVAFALISKGFHNEIKEGRALAFGSGFMDFLYCLLAFSGIGLIVSVLPSSVAAFYAAHVRQIIAGLTFAGCVFVMIYGLKIMKTKMAYNTPEADKNLQLDSAFARVNHLRERAAARLKIPDIKRSRLAGSFFTGVLLCATSLALPAAWMALVGYLKGLRFLDSSFVGGLLFSLGAFAGTVAWYGLLLKLITGHKKRINETTVNKLNAIAGAILLALGAILFIKAVVSVFSLA